MNVALIIRWSRLNKTESRRGVGRLDGDDEIGRIGDHHIGDLIERLAGDVNA